MRWHLLSTAVGICSHVSLGFVSWRRVGNWRMTTARGWSKVSCQKFRSSARLRHNLFPQRTKSEELSPFSLFSKHSSYWKGSLWACLWCSSPVGVDVSSSKWQEYLLQSFEVDTKSWRAVGEEHFAAPIPHHLLFSYISTFPFLKGISRE